MKKHSDAFAEAVVGVFVAAVLALLVYFTIVISGVDLLAGRERVRFTATFTDVGGLKERDSVMYRGMKVGTVERIDLAGANVRVRVLADRGVRLREGCRISVEALSLLGGNYLLLEEGEGRELQLAGGEFQGVPRSDFMRDVGRIAAKFGDGGALDEALRGVAAAASNLNAIAARVERGEGTVGKLLSADDKLYRDLEGAVAGAKETFAGAAAVVRRVEEGKGLAGKLLADDDSLYADLKRTAASAAEIAARLERGEGALGKLLDAKEEAAWTDLRETLANLRAATAKLKAEDGLLARLAGDKAMADDAAELLANLRKVSGRLERGEGTLGRLMADAELHNEVSALVKDIRQIVDNYRDTTPITTFGALATGAL